MESFFKKLFKLFGHTMEHVGSEFLYKGSNPQLLPWKRSLNHWTTIEVPRSWGILMPGGAGVSDRLTLSGRECLLMSFFSD